MQSTVCTFAREVIILKDSYVAIVPFSLLVVCGAIAVLKIVDYFHSLSVRVEILIILGWFWAPSFTWIAIFSAWKRFLNRFFVFRNPTYSKWNYNVLALFPRPPGCNSPNFLCVSHRCSQQILPFAVSIRRQSGHKFCCGFFWRFPPIHAKVSSSNPFQWGNAGVCSWGSSNFLFWCRNIEVKSLFDRRCPKVSFHTECQLPQNICIWFVTSPLVIDCISFLWRLVACVLFSTGSSTRFGWVCDSWICSCIPFFANNKSFHCCVFSPRKSCCNSCCIPESVDNQGSFSWSSSWLRHVVLLKSIFLSYVTVVYYLANWAIAVQLPLY